MDCVVPYPLEILFQKAILDIKRGIDMIKKILFISIALFIISVPVYLYVEIGLLPKIMAEKDKDNPLRKSEEEIIEYLLEFVPIGTSMDDFIKFLGSSKDWKVYYNGGTKILWSDLPEDAASSYLKKYVEWKEIDVSLGEYDDVLRTTYIRVIWKFNDDLELIEIVVHKDVDSL